jgi:thioredoxin 1
MQEGLIKTLTEENFEQTVIQGGNVVLVDFWATWCGPCRMVSPVIDEIAKDFAGKITVGKINVDEQPKLAEQYRIMTIPTIMLFKNGQMVNRKSGAFPKTEYAAMVNQAL